MGRHDGIASSRDELPSQLALGRRVMVSLTNIHTVRVLRSDGQILPR